MDRRLTLLAEDDECALLGTDSGEVVQMQQAARSSMAPYLELIPAIHLDDVNTVMADGESYPMRRYSAFGRTPPGIGHILTVPAVFVPPIKQWVVGPSKTQTLDPVESLTQGSE